MIRVRRSNLQVTDYTWNDSPSLEYKFSVYDILTHSYYYKGISYDESKKILYLPRGMDIQLVQRYTKSTAIIDKEIDPWSTAGKVYIKYLPKNDVQKQTIRFILGMGEYEYTRPYSQLCINLMTGKGKTYVTIASMAYEESKFIVITAVRDWLKQWKDKALEYTDFKEKEILQLHTSDMCKIVDGRLDTSNIKMFTCTHSSFGEFASKYGWDAVDLLFKRLNVKYKIFDEAHLYFDSISMIDFHSNTYKTLYLTASPFKSNDKENEIYKRYFEFVPSIELFDKERDAMAQYISVHYNSHPTPYQIMNCMNKFGLIKARYIDYCLKNDNFWKVVYCCFCEAILPNPGRTLILTETNPPIQIIKQWIESNFPEYIGQIGTFQGETSEKDRAIAKQCKIVITNRMCGGTCLDIQNLGVCFPVLVPTKSRVITQQLFGRVGREGATLPNFLYLDIVDEGFRKLKEFYTFRLPVFMKYATKCSKVLYRDYDLNQRYEHYSTMRNRG